MTKFLTPVFIIMLAIACSTPKEPINLKPMYGYAPKQAQHIEADMKFLEQCDKDFKTRKEASDYYTKIAWGYYEKGDFSTAMKRFNQAWLLDSTNCQVYWGFGNIRGYQQKMEESNTLLNKALMLNCTNPYIYESMTSNWFGLYTKTINNQYLDSAQKSIDYNLQKEPGNARVLNQKSVYYYYRGNHDSALVYAYKVMSIDTSIIKPTYLNVLKSRVK